MARYELGAIYKIDANNGEVYYIRLLTGDCYGVFDPIKGEDLSQETFSQTPYRLYFCCNTFPVKRNVWEKALPSPDKTDTIRWQRPEAFANFASFNMKLFLDQCRIFRADGNLYPCESKEEFIKLIRSGMISNIFNRHENIPVWLNNYYEGYPDSELLDKTWLLSGTPEYQKEQAEALAELGYDISSLLQHK